MKKLLTLAVVAATASLSQAATLNWSAMTIYQPKTTTALSGGLALLFVTSQTETTGTFGAGVTTIDDVIAFIEGGATAVVDETSKKVTALKKGDNTIDVAASGVTTSTGMLSGNTGYYGS